MDHKKRVLSLTTTNQLVENVSAVLEDIWNSTAERNDELLGPELTIGMFKELTGFYASDQILKLMTGAYVARLTRFYLLEIGGITPKQVGEIFQETEELEWAAVKIIKKNFTEKYGPVSEERVKELDSIGHVINRKNAEMLRKLLRGESYASQPA